MENLGILVRRAAKGDVEAFAEIVRRFRDMAYGYAYSILGDFHLAEDAAQEAFIEAYGSLVDLRSPSAFPGWFRRIVFKHCDRIVRRKRVPTVPIESAVAAASDETGPAERAERRELEDRVLEAVRGLAEQQREVVTLFYIDGYSQSEIAEFLEEPLTTVKKRLHDSRKKLRERMANMVSETLKGKVPDERFSQRVVERLLARPRLLEIEGHPVRRVYDIIRTELVGYEYVAGEEIVGKSRFVIDPVNVYQPAEDRMLRPELTLTLLDAAVGRTSPVRFFSAGRVFRPDEEDANHLKVFNTVDILHIDAGVTVEMMEHTVQRVLEAVIGPLKLNWIPDEFPRFEHGQSPAIRKGKEWIELAGCGMLTEATLTEGGFDPDQVSGFGFGLGLERLAMLKYGIGDVRELSQPPYVPQGAH